MATSPTTTRSMHLGVLPSSYFTFDDRGSLRLAGGRCGACGAVSFPKADVCPSCLGEEIVSAELTSHGTLYTYTVLHLGKPGEIVPCAVGYVDLPEGVRLFAHLTATAGLQPDMPVTLYVTDAGADQTGEARFAYGFGPAAEDQTHA